MKQKLFSNGLAAGFPICLGYLPISFAFGIFATESGMTILETFFVSVTNFTSAGQLAAVPIIAAGGSLAELALAQLIINLRYALMAVSMSQKMDKNVNLFDRFVIAFAITDENFAVVAGKQGDVGKQFLYGLISTPYLGWCIGTLIGACAGQILPATVTSALGIAIYGMFIAIVVPPMKKHSATSLCVLVAIILSCIFAYVPILKVIPFGFTIIICAVAASMLFAAIAPLRFVEEDEDHA